MVNPNVEREFLDSGIEVVRSTETNIQAGIEKRIAVEFRDSKRVTRYSADFGQNDHPFNVEVMIGADTGTPLVAVLARLKLAYGRSVEITHGGEESALNNALSMKEVYNEDNFFSGISFTFQTLDEIHLFHSVTGDKSRYKGTIALGESMEHPSVWHPFPYLYSARREGANLAFSRIWRPDSANLTLIMPEDITSSDVSDQIKGNEWVKTKDRRPVTLNISQS